MQEFSTKKFKFNWQQRFQRTVTAYHGLVAVLLVVTTPGIGAERRMPAEWFVNLGGGGTDISRDLAADSEGNILVTGYTYSKDWLIGLDASYEREHFAFAVKLNPSGTLLWAKYFGATNIYGLSRGTDIAVDGADNVVLTGLGDSRGWDDKPINGGQAGHDNTFVTKLNSQGTHLWTTFVVKWDSGPAAVAIDNVDNIVVCGRSGYWPTAPFVAKLSPDGRELWSTNLTEYGWGTGRSESFATGVATDGAGNILVTGFTYGGQLVARGGYDITPSRRLDAFLVKLNSDGRELWSTYVGEDSWGVAIAVDGSGDILVGGGTAATNGWVSGGYNTTNHTGEFVAKISQEDGRHIWSTYVGTMKSGWLEDVGVDREGNVMVTGGYWYGAFVEKLSRGGAYLWTWSIEGRRVDGRFYYEKSSAVTADRLGSVLVTGSTYDDGWVESRYPDIFVAKISEPRLIRVELVASDRLRLTIEAGGFTVEALAVEGTDSLANSIGWLREDGAVIVRNTAGTFEATLLRQGGTRFYRVRATQ